ncbi:MAG: hypothetical protein WCT53_06005 [Candidatus Gracilibacteria bacterium]
MNVPFDLNGWDYENADQGIQQLAKTIKQRTGKRGLYLPYLPKFCGGKGLSLAICDLFEMTDSIFSVPRRNFLSKEQVGLIIGGKAICHFDGFDPGGRLVMVRSSAPNEDWKDSRSGVETSFSWSRNIALSPSFISKLSLMGQAIVQEIVCGVGLVVDVGYSHLLKKPVVRIAHGRPADNTGKCYTSAVWDLFSPVGLYGSDGSALIPLADKVFGALAPELASRAVLTAQTIGIDFGFQMEVIIHPGNLEKWHLVQIRPSPEFLRGMTQTPKIIFNRHLETSLRVSRAGSVTSEIKLLDAEAKKEALRRMQRPGFYGKCAEKILRPFSEYGDKVILWKNISALDIWTLHTVLTMGRIGALGQLATTSLCANYHHFYVKPYGEGEKLSFREALSGSLLMEISKKAESKLTKIAQKGAQVHLVSDGLVGQIYAV